MKKVMTAGLVLSAVVAASGKVHAEVNYPWCLMGDTRGYECVFSSREQCAQDGRNRGFGGQCIQNPFYKPGQPPTVSGAVKSARPSQGASAAYSTCTGMKSFCLSHGAGDNHFFEGPSNREAALERARPYRENFCNSEWEQCTKTGWWAAHHRAERR